MRKKPPIKTKIDKELKELVITRVDAQTPSNLKLSIGSNGKLSKEEVIEHIKKEDEIGQQIVAVHVSFLKAIASGKLTKAMSSI